MKNIIKYSCFILLVLSFSACKGDKLSNAKKKFTGNWQYLGIKYEDGEMEDRSENTLPYTDFNLMKDGTCELQTFLNADPENKLEEITYPKQSGTWKVEERPFHGAKAIYIVINYELAGKPEEEAHAVVGISKNELQWMDGYGDTEWREYFRKVEVK